MRIVWLQAKLQTAPSASSPGTSPPYATTQPRSLALQRPKLHSVDTLPLLFLTCLYVVNQHQICRVTEK